MFFHLKIIIRNLQRGGIYSYINVGGLAIGMAAAILIVSWIYQSNYAYRTDIPWWLFVVVGGMSLFIALATVGFQAVKAAMENPVKAIKSE